MITLRVFLDAKRDGQTYRTVKLRAQKQLRRFLRKNRLLTKDDALKSGFY